MAHVFQTQLMSLVVEGVFDRFPETRVALHESVECTEPTDNTAENRVVPIEMRLRRVRCKPL